MEDKNEIIISLIRRMKSNTNAADSQTRAGRRNLLEGARRAYSANGKDLPGQSHLAGHCKVLLNGPSQCKRQHRGDHRAPSTRPVFRRCACWDMQMEPGVCKELVVRVSVEQNGSGNRVGDLGALLHHIAEMPGEVKRAFAFSLFYRRRFDVQR